MNIEKTESAEEISKKYGILLKDAKRIISEFGTFEEFIEKYKKHECDFQFDKKTFVGERGIAISSKELTEEEKSVYFNLYRGMRYGFEYDGLCILNIDAIDEAMSQLDLDVRDILESSYGLNKPKVPMSELAEKYGKTQKYMYKIRQNCEVKLNGKLRGWKGVEKKSSVVTCEFAPLLPSKEEMQTMDEDERDWRIQEHTRFEEKYANEIRFYLEQENLFDPKYVIPPFLKRQEKKEEKKQTIIINGKEYGMEDDIKAFGFSVRTYNSLLRAGISGEIGEFLEFFNGMDTTDVKNFGKNIRNMGKTSRDEVINKMLEIGVLKYDENSEKSKLIQSIRGHQIELNDLLAKLNEHEIDLGSGSTSEDER